MPPARKKRRVGSARGLSATSTSAASTAALGSELYDVKGDADGSGSEQEEADEAAGDDTVRAVDGTDAEGEGGDETVEGNADEDPEDPETEEERKERESRERIYAEFAEEYYDIVEQLPLEIKRNFTLIAEWEAALQEGELKLRERLIEYVRLVAPRALASPDGLAAPEDAEASAVADDPTTAVSRVDTPMTNGAASEAAEDDEAAVAAQLLALAAGPAVAVPKPNGHADKSAPNGAADASPSAAEVDADETGQRRRKLMLEIAGLMDSAVKKGQDKVNLATTVYDWVDRHINRLDADLLKFEDATVLGLRPGTLPSHDAPSAAHFVADNPPSARRLRLTGAFANASSSSGGQAPRAGTVTNRARDKKRAQDKSAAAGEKSKKGRSVSPDKHGSTAAAGPSGGSRAARPLPPARAAVSEDMAVDPNEPRYCYCNQVSFGTMVGCDNPDCEREWFHLSCAGLTAPPANKWFCRDCGPRRN